MLWLPERRLAVIQSNFLAPSGPTLPGPARHIRSSSLLRANQLDQKGAPIRLLLLQLLQLVIIFLKLDLPLPVIPPEEDGAVGHEQTASLIPHIDSRGDGRAVLGHDAHEAGVVRLVVRLDHGGPDIGRIHPERVLLRVAVGVVAEEEGDGQVADVDHLAAEEALGGGDVGVRARPSLGDAQ